MLVKDSTSLDPIVIRDSESELETIIKRETTINPLVLNKTSEDSTF